MRKFTLSSILIFVALTGFATTWTVVNSGNTFSPAMLTIMAGDDVNFDLDAIHNSVEVSEATWNANGTTPLPGGWALPLGGGNVPAGMLTVGIHYYVCQPHASEGMKGIIVVETSTSTDNPFSSRSFSIYPNPSNGWMHLMLENEAFLQDSKLEVYDLHGQQVYQSVISKQENQEIEINLATLPKGIYFVRLYNDKAIHSRRIMLQ